MEHREYKYLYKVNSPDDLRGLSPGELPAYCDEVRQYIIENLAYTPGHLGSSLGAVELSVALHYVFDTPRDKIIWDVGHQAYAHKIITGRRDRFPTLRKLGGIAGFPRPEESPYDAVTGGHASTSVSSALGIAIANRLKGSDEHVAAVIGDGAMTGGLAFEGMNNAGVSKSDILVILNDNRIAIDTNTGALKEYLLSITTSRRYNKLKTRIWNMFQPGSHVHNALKKTSNAIKHGLLQQSNMFESFGFRYFGPVDGHDVESLVKVLQDLKRIGGPKLLHTLTVKGKGYAPAENDQPIWHAPGKFNPDTGVREADCISTTPSASQPPILSKEGKTPAKFQEVFGETLLELARADERIVGITPAMPTGSSLNLMMAEMPERTFDVGIAEGHAVTFAAGLAAGAGRTGDSVTQETGAIVPFCVIYSSFVQRAYDNIIHDVAIGRLPVVLCIDRGGLVGEDGSTHHGVFDIAALLPVPGLVISSPMDEAEMRNLMYTASRAGVPFVIRYPKGNGPGTAWRCAEFSGVPVGKGRCLRSIEDHPVSSVSTPPKEGNPPLAILSFGPVGNFAAGAAERAGKEGIPVAHYDLRFAKPLDEDLLHEVGKKFKRVISVEDGAVRGGVGSAVEDFFARNCYNVRVEKLGVPDRFIEHGSQAELYHECGYDTEGIYNVIVNQDYEL